MHISPDIVLSGKSSLDGETSQVPPETAEMAGYNFVSNVSSIEIAENGVIVARDEDNGIRKLEVLFPVFLSVSEKINRARQIDPSAKVENIDVYDSRFTAWKGSDSPTSVVDTFSMANTRDNKFITFDEFLGILDASGEVKQDPDYKILDDPATEEIFLGLAVDDPGTSLEISSKIAEIGGHRIVVIGNINPSRLNGMACHKYIYLDNSDYVSFSEYVAEFNRKHAFSHSCHIRFSF